MNEKLNLRFVPADLAICGVVHPQQIHAHPELAEFKYYDMFAEWLKEDGFVVGDLGACEQVMLLGWVEKRSTPPKYAIELRYPQAVTHRIIHSFVQQPSEVETEHATFYVPKDQSMPWACLVGERTLLLARKPQLTKMVEAQEGGEGTVKKLLSKLPPKTITLVTDLSAFQPEVEGETLPPPDSNVDPLQYSMVACMFLTQAIVITLNLDPEMQLQCSVLPRRDTDYEKLTAALNDTVRFFGRQSASQSQEYLDRLGPNPPPSAVANLNRTFELIDAAFSRLIAKQQGDLIEMSISGTVDVGLIVAIMLPAFELARQAAIKPTQDTSNANQNQSPTQGG